MTEGTRSTIRVECYAGYRAEETPRRFWLGERCIEVVDVVDRWLESGTTGAQAKEVLDEARRDSEVHRYFKVKGEDGGIYILRHDTNKDTWQMTLFDSGRRPETKLSAT